MMIVILTILKVIGIILAVLLGLVLLVLGIILFVPLRCRARMFRTSQAAACSGISPDEEQKAENSPGEKALWGISLRVKWLLGAVRLEGRLAPEGYAVHLKVLWKTLKTFGTLPEPVVSKAKRAEKAPSKQQEEAYAPEPADRETKDKPGAERQPEQAEDVGAETRKASGQERESDVAEEAVHAEDRHTSAETQERHKAEHSQETKAERHFTPRSILQEISRLPERIMAGIDWLWETLEGGAERIAEAVDKLQARLEGIKKRLDPFLDSRARAWYGRTLGHLKKALHHYRIRKVTGWAHIGTGSPDTSALLYGLLQKGLPAGSKAQMETDLYEACAVGDLQFSGHVRMNHLAWAAIRMLADKDTRLMYRRMRRR